MLRLELTGVLKGGVHASGEKRIGAARRLAIAGVYLCGYVFLDWISFVHELHGLAITPWNPSPGLSLALLLVYGLGYSPLVFTAPLVSSLVVPSIVLPPSVIVLGASVIGSVYSIAAFALGRFCRLDPALSRLRDLLYVFAVGSGAAAVAAVALVGLYATVGLIPIAGFSEAAFQFWLGDAIGIVVLTPLLLLLQSRSFRLSLPRRITAARLFEIGLQATAIFGALAVIFGVVHGVEQFKYFYLLFLPLVWIAVRHGILGAAWAVLAIQAGLITGIALHSHSTEDVRSFQVVMFALAVTGYLLGAVVSERRRIEIQARAHEAELAHVSRLSVAGEMASALAHELNQPLTAISAYAQGCRRLLKSAAHDPAALQEAMLRIFEQSDRAGSIIHRLRDFLREGIAHRSTVPVDLVLREALALAQVEAGQSGIELKTQIPSGLPELIVDRIQVEQVILNLVRNAVDAITGARMTGGTVTVEAEQRNKTIEIRVVDTGPGLSDEIADRVFDPFVTTKARGMGLGLSISRSIVAAHGGELTAERHSGGGALFRFTLPVQAGERGNGE